MQVKNWPFFFYRYTKNLLYQHFWTWSVVILYLMSIDDRWFSRNVYFCSPSTHSHSTIALELFVLFRFRLTLGYFGLLYFIFLVVYCLLFIILLWKHKNCMDESTNRSRNCTLLLVLSVRFVYIRLAKNKPQININIAVDTQKCVKSFN